MKCMYSHLLALLLVTIVVNGQEIPSHPEIWEEESGTFSEKINRTPDRAPFQQENATWLMAQEFTTRDIRHAIVVHDTLYALERRESTYYLNKWDGTTWRRLTSFGLHPFRGARNITALLHYNEEFYITGSFYHIDAGGKILGTTGIARWNGTEWLSVGGGFPAVADGEQLKDAIIALQIYQGKLYCGGTFSKIGGIQANNIARWNGSQWEEVADGVQGTSILDRATVIQGMQVYRDQLYVGGNFSQAGSAPSKNLARWNGTSWSSVDDISVNKGVVGVLGVYNDELIVSAASFSSDQISVMGQVMRWNGSRWDTLGGWATYDFTAVGFHVYNGKLYAAHAPFNSGIRISRWDDDHWTSLGYPGEVNTRLLEYEGSLLAVNADEGGWERKGLYRLCDSYNCARISGIIYHDANGDCSPGTSQEPDAGVRGRIIEITPGPYHVTSDMYGRYSQFLPSGTYTVRLLPFLHWEWGCSTPITEYSVGISEPNQSATDKNFGIRPIPNITDIRVGIGNTVARPGFSTHYTVTAENIGTVPVEGVIRFEYDPSLTFQSGTQGIHNVGSGIAEWPITALAPGESRTARVQLLVPASTPLGTQLCATAGFLPVQQEFNEDDQDILCTEVRGSFDPNDISVTPFGAENDGVITPHDTVLTYLVRFQNTGTDTAFRVMVLDTLPAYLDASTITVGPASHPFTFAMKGRGELRWTFDNILLPDSTTNEPESHGFLRYSVKLKPGTPVETVITNRASIYFDYNIPVLTNTVESIIRVPAGVPLPAASSTVLFPNPTSGELTLRGEGIVDGMVIVRDMLGRQVFSAMAEKGKDILLDLAAFPAGPYLVSIPVRDGIAVERIMVVR